MRRIASRKRPAGFGVPSSFVSQPVLGTTTQSVKTMHRHRFSTPVRNRCYRRPLDRQKFQRWIVAITGGGALAAGFLFVCWQHVEATRLGYESERLKRHIAELDGERRRLEIERQKRLAPAALDEQAKKRGMAPPTSAQTVGAEVTQ